MSGKVYLKPATYQYQTLRIVPTTPSRSTSSTRPSSAPRSIHRDREILVALLEKDVQEVGVRNKVLRDAEVVVQAANAQLGEQLNRVEENIASPVQPSVNPDPFPESPHQPHRSIPPSTQTRSQKVQHLASPEMARCSGLQSSTPATDSYGCRRTVTRESGSDIPSKPEPTLVWISSDEETGYPDDSEDSEDVGDDHWAPVSAAEVSSDEDEPLPGPGGITVAEVKARRAQKFSKAGEKTYVVYHGRNGTSGLYFEWRGSHGATGALELTDDFFDAAHRSFDNRKLAAKAYKECKITGVLDILKSSSQPKENLILIKGENPGVYNRRTLLKQGLRWHGGKVVVHIGTAYDAQQMFLALEREGKTMKLPTEKSWGLA
ncbi:MAG: hypothetical protein NXY57DRAFT_1110202 [Lentinula lateritia]|nr:MAG: hypothetical protein NXY57DRAFT_1110202 [Lentinula lateritia]